MNSRNGSGPVSSPDDFEEALRLILYEALLEGVNVEGGWDVSTGDRDDIPDFAVEIVRMGG